MKKGITLILLTLVFLIFSSSVVANDLNTESSIYNEDNENICISPINDDNLANNEIAIDKTSINTNDNITTTSYSNENREISNNESDLRDFTYINANDLKSFYGENKIFNITLTNAKEPLSNQNIQFIINNQCYNEITDENGNAFLNIDLSPGVYEIETKYDGNNIYQPTKTTSIITITSKTTKIKTHIIGCILFEYNGDYNEYSIQLLDEENNPIENQPINLKIIGKTYVQKTDLEGIARLPIKLKAGTYDIEVSYDGNILYEPVVAQRYTVFVYDYNEKIDTSIIADDFSQLYGENKFYEIQLINKDNKPLAFQEIEFLIIGKTYKIYTDCNGVAKLPIRLMPGSYDIDISYKGNNLYNSASTHKTVNVLSVNIVGDLNNEELQNLIDNTPSNEAVKLAALTYNNISININKPVILTTTISTLIGTQNKTVITLNGNNCTINGFNIIANNGNAIQVNSNDNQIANCNIENNLSSELLNQYSEGTILMPGKGIEIINAENTLIKSNKICNYYEGIYIENSNNTSILDNHIIKNNYGIEFGYNSSNTLIKNNKINENIGVITMNQVEGPLGYGISLKHSGVNVTILNNKINNNYMGIFIDAKNCTGIIIIGNEITNSTIEGLTFNENYTFCENAIQPIVTNNAIYNNAKGPSMIVLGEVSANPAGIYGPGEWNDSEKLELGANWYGQNKYITWGNITGAGTICPRIHTYLIQYELTYIENGKYLVTFYNNKTIASELPDFTIFFTLNFYTDKEIEKEITIHNGIGILEFPIDNYYETDNIIEGSSGSLFDTTRTFNIISTYTVPDNEIPRSN